MAPHLKNSSYRKEVLAFAAQRYGTQPEFLWASNPQYAVLRHSHNPKWYGLIMNVSGERLGLEESGQVDILDLKCDPIMIGSLLSQPGILPGYHMHKGNWISVLLDGTVELEQIFFLLDLSFSLTSRRGSQRPSNAMVDRDWLIPANPHYFDLEKAFAQSDVITWKQSSRVLVGDLIYIYMAAPVSAVLYQCRAVEVDIPYQYQDQNVRMNRVMKIKLLHRFSPDQLSREVLREYGVTAVRGPRSVPNRLHWKIHSLLNMEDSEK